MSESNRNPTVTGRASPAKLRRRHHISDTAVRLFAARGFDAVTIAQVAEEAGVAKMTVTNHFPRKEDLFLDRLDEQLQQVRAVLIDSDPDAPAAAIRDYELDLLDHGSPLAGTTATPQFWGILISSDVLVNRLHEHFRNLGEVITNHLLESAWEPETARLEGTLLGAAMSYVHFEALSRSQHGTMTATSIAQQRDTINCTFRRLQSGI